MNERQQQMQMETEKYSADEVFHVAKLAFARGLQTERIMVPVKQLVDSRGKVYETQNWNTFDQIDKRRVHREGLSVEGVDFNFYVNRQRGISKLNIVFVDEGIDIIKAVSELKTPEKIAEHKREGLTTVFQLTEDEGYIGFVVDAESEDEARKKYLEWCERNNDFHDISQLKRGRYTFTRVDSLK